MASRLTRWTIASGVGLVAVFVATLPPGPSMIQGPFWRDPGPVGPAGLVAANEGALQSARERLTLALRKQSLLQAAPKGAGPVVVRFVGNDAIRDPVMTAAADSAWTLLPRAADAPRVLLVETDRQRMNERWQLGASDLCVTAFDSLKANRVWTIRQGAGACALATQFGPPGAPMRAWLDTVGMVSFQGMVVPQGDRDELSSFDWWGDMNGAYGRDREQWACAGGRRDQCLEGLGFHQGGPHETWPKWARYGYRPLTSLLPAALLAELGPERFAQLWRGNEPLPIAYQHMTGRPFDEWAMTYVQGFFGRVEKDNALTPLGWLGWVLWMGIVLVWFAVRMERRSAT